MGRQTDAFRKMHPEQFSDSKVIHKGNLDRDFLDFFFETLTSKCLEKEFEDFCRHIAEVEICPNLLPQTGPTGGGDSKVDSETYPVAEGISELWYYGDGNKAASERWAFAISAKKDWKPKVKSDVVKISKVNQDENRGYCKIFFMSNQFISDKKRAETEDELRKLYNLDIRIIDRTWLLDKALKDTRNVAITIKSFALSKSFSDEVQTGERDYKRKLECEQIENQLVSNEVKPAEMVALSQRSIILARELEYSKQQMYGLIDRNFRIVKEYGTIINQADAVYEAAWTIFWWYSDTQNYYTYYKEYEKIALSENNVDLFGHLVTLWINLHSLSLDNKDICIDEHASNIKEKYAQYISEPSKPNTAIEAKASYQLMRFFLGDTPDDIVNDMIQILDDSFGHLDLDLRPISRAIQEIPIFEKAERYDELFERIVSIMSKRKQNSEAALMLIKRGRSIKDKKPYEALSYFSRTLMSLYNEENKSNLIGVIMDMGDVFQSVGLLWAARNFYYYVFCLCVNQYMKFGIVFPALFISAHMLKYIELRLGHVLYAVGFNHLAKVSEHLYPKKLELKDKDDDNFDYVLAIQILRTSYEVEKSLGQLPAYLAEHGLDFSSAAMKYELGYYDESMLALLNGNTDAFDDLIAKWKDQPALAQLNHLPWYGVEPSYSMQTSILGCSIELNIIDYNHGEFEFGATILAMIESFFGTGVTNELISGVGKIIIELRFDDNCKVLMGGEILSDRPNEIKVIAGEFDSNDIVNAQNEFADFLIKLIGMVAGIMFPYDSAMKKIEKMIKDDAAFERSQTFSNSVFYGMNILGKDMFSFSSIIRDFECMKMKRKQKSEITDVVCSKDEVESSSPYKIHYGKPPDDVDFKSVSNADISTSSIINVPLWDICKWNAVCYLIEPKRSFPPVFSLVFLKNNCKSIFEEWIKEIGNNDNDNKIGIRVIKGINKEHPYWYRVAIGQLKFPPKKGKRLQIMAMQARLLTMTPISDVNLKMFEKELKIVKKFLLCPSYMMDHTEQPQIYRELVIQKNIESIMICDACDVQDNDLLSQQAILPTDNPIIPLGKENAPVLAIIERRQQYFNKQRN